MDLLKVVAIGVTATIAIIILKPIKPEVSLLLGIGAAILISLMVADDLFEVIYSFYSIAEATAIDKSIFNNILKIIGIGYLTEFANNICVDSDSKSVGAKIVFAGKIAIMVLALPIIKSLVGIIVEILP